MGRCAILRVGLNFMYLDRSNREGRRKKVVGRTTGIVNASHKGVEVSLIA